MNNRTNHRQVGRVAIAVLLLVLAFSAVGAAGCLYLTPGDTGGGIVAHVAWRAPEVLLTDGEGTVAISIAGMAGFVAAGQSYLEEPAKYAGELVVGPYEFVP